MTKEKKRFGALDAVIILLVLAAAAVVVLYFNLSGGGTAVEVEYTVEFKAVRKTFEGMPQVGDKVYDSVKGYYLGVVTDVWYEESTYYTWNHYEQQYETAVAPNEIDCFLKILSNGLENDDVITVGSDNTDVRVGKLMFVKGKGYANSGYIVGLTTKEKGE